MLGTYTSDLKSFIEGNAIHVESKEFSCNEKLFIEKRFKEFTEGRFKQYFESKEIKFDINTFAINLNKLFSDKKDEIRFISDKYEIAFLALLPYNLSQYTETCNMQAIKYCHKYCIGNYNTSEKTQSMNKLMRTVLFTHYKNLFLQYLVYKINELNNEFNKKTLCVRLNGYSDILWENIPLNESIFKYSFSDKSNEEVTIFKLFDKIQFYDYTKYKPYERDNCIKNYHITYSYNFTYSEDELRKYIIDDKYNFAFICSEEVFTKILGKNPLVKRNINGREIIFINGDINDYRFLDNEIESYFGKIILLCAQDINIEEISEGHLIQDVVTNIEYFNFL